MNWRGWLVILMMGANALWMTVDAGQALVNENYITPTSGAYAGQLGPWADLLGNAGIDVNSISTKTVFMIYGTVTIYCLLSFHLRRKWAWWGLVVMAVLGLWYVPFGTVLNGLSLILLLRLPLRQWHFSLSERFQAT
jgi:hypothetical protein